MREESGLVVQNGSRFIWCRIRVWFLIYSALYPHEYCGLQQLSLDLMHSADSVAAYYFQTS